MHATVSAKLIIMLGLVPLLCVFLVVPPALDAADNMTLDTVLSNYESLKPHVMTLTGDIREARKDGRAIDPGKILLVRKELSDFVKMLRRYDKDHLRAAKGVKTYPDRDKILRLFHVSDAIYRWLEAETKSTDFQILGLKYEEMWKQADGALAGGPSRDR